MEKHLKFDTEAPLEYLGLLYRETFGLSMAQFNDPDELEGFQFWAAIRGFREESARR